MTALDKYAKLEAIARYRDGPTDRMREVVLSFGERTLMIVGLDDQPISHWPLVNVHRMSAPGDTMVLLAPFEGSTERIELGDPDMIEAIDTIVPRKDTPRRHRRRPLRVWRMILGIGVLGTAAALVWAWPMLMERVVDLVPRDRAIVIGDVVRAEILSEMGLEEDAAGATCADPEGRAALDQLLSLASTVGSVEGAFPDGTLREQVSVLDHPATLVLGLPGGDILLTRGMIDIAGTPEALTAILAHEIAHVRARNPMRKILRHATLSEKAAHVLGDLINEPVPKSAATALTSKAYLADEDAHADAAVTKMLNNAALPTTPYAALLFRLDVTAAPGPRYGDLHPLLKIRASRADAADAVGTAPYKPVLSDRDWLVLQTICGGI